MSVNDHEKPRPVSFDLGQVLITPAAMTAIPAEKVQAALARHAAGDWGVIDEHDRRENELALASGFRLFSVYELKDGIRFWIITEADRSATTVLLPEDY
ncbi:MAG: hypothetical protein AB7F89_20255, partial [Pirellulaceae bacterium]